MRTIERTNQFKRDYKRETKGRSKAYVQKLEAEFAAVLQVLMVDGTLDPRYEDHPLTGEWRDHRDCHVRPDLLLLYRKSDQDALILVRLGSHSELFRK
jgi:mRNA interferase YafQ